MPRLAEPELFRAVAADARLGVGHSPQCGLFAQRYYPVYFAGSHQDVSFAVCEGDEPLLAVFATRSPNGLDYYGAPVQFFAAGGLSEAAVKLAFTHLDEIGLNAARIADGGSLQRLSPVGKACLDRQFRPSVSLTASADLTHGEEGLRQGLRKSYKSLLNWGKNNQAIIAVDAANPDRGLFDRYQDFHHKVAGRVTRAQETWDAMFALIAEGAGELLLGFLPGDDLVAGTMVFDAGDTAFYASGVYDRDRFEMPLAHWPLWLAMVRAQARGRKRFELGAVPIAGTAADKEIAIGYFKRGFATDMMVSLVWSREGATGE
jgi:hypothetical protein